MKAYNDILVEKTNTSISHTPSHIEKDPDIKNIWEKIKNKYSDNQKIIHGAFCASMLPHKPSIIQSTEQIIDLLMSELKSHLSEEETTSFALIQSDITQVKKKLNVMFNNKNIKNENIELLLLGYLLEILTKK